MDGWEEACGEEQRSRFKRVVVWGSGALLPDPSCREKGSALPEGWLQARSGRCSPPLALLCSWATLDGVAFTAAAAHEYAICCYICSRSVIPLQPCGYVAFHFADKTCQNGFKNEVKAFLYEAFVKKPQTVS